MTWAPDYVAEWNRRAVLRNDCLENPALRAVLEQHYKNNPIDWIEDSCVTFDPRRKGVKLMPFLLFKRQKEFIQFLYDCWQDKESGLAEKARDIGATWLCCAFSVWLWKYHAGSVIGWGSRKSEYVDKMGDPKAIFPKMRQIINNLPVWQMPRGWNPMVHSTFMRILNPATESAITGESGDNMGRGGRTTIYFKDESAHYEHPDLVEAALGDNTDVQIDISSVNGTANLFYRRRMAGELWTPGVTPTKGRTRVFIFDWRQHPGKSQAWYDQRREKAVREGLLHIFAQEVERNYTGSQERVIIPAEWIEAAVDAHKVIQGMEIGESISAQDIADGGADRNAWGYKKGVVLKYAEAWGGMADDAAAVAVPLCITHGARELHYDSIGVGASFKTAINFLKKTMPGYPKMRVFPWNAGASVLDPEDCIIPTDSESPTNEDTYENLKAQAWFRTRARFYKTFRMVRHGEQYPKHELISIDSTIPCLEQIKVELSQAKHKASENGRTLVEKKPEGEPSPNLADMIVILYNPNRDVSIFDVL